MACILFVDDDRLTLQLMQRLAGFVGHQALISSSPEQGLQMAKDEKPDLIMVDMFMQDMNGLAFVKALRDCDGAASIPVIVLSAGEGRNDEERALQAGADGYINKAAGRRIAGKAVKTFVTRSQ
jgi:CheY-like chemotaxis protein